MAHYDVDGIKVPAVIRPNVGQMMYGEECAGKGTTEMRSTEILALQFVVSIRQYPDLRTKYTWDRITDIDGDFPYEILRPISDADDEKLPEMVPDPTAPAAGTEKSDSSASIPIPPLENATGNTSTNSPTISGGAPTSYGL